EDLRVGRVATIEKNTGQSSNRPCLPAADTWLCANEVWQSDDLPLVDFLGRQNRTRRSRLLRVDRPSLSCDQDTGRERCEFHPEINGARFTWREIPSEL